MEKKMATHSSTLAWKIPWTEELGAGYCPWGRKESGTTERLQKKKKIKCYYQQYECLFENILFYSKYYSFNFDNQKLNFILFLRFWWDIHFHMFIDVYLCELSAFSFCFSLECFKILLFIHWMKNTFLFHHLPRGIKFSIMQFRACYLICFQSWTLISWI